MDDFETLFARAKDERAFSNGTEGYGWVDAHCSYCIHDQSARVGDGTEGCPLILVSLLGRTPAEWLPGDPYKPDGFSIPEQYQCVMFRHEDDGGDPEPKPIPTPPGQGELFPRDGLEGVRMLKPLPAEVRTEVSA
jgi:hypothetical protein